MCTCGVHAAAVAVRLEEAAVAGVAGITAGELVPEAGLLVRDAATGSLGGPALELHSLASILWKLWDECIDTDLLRWRLLTLSGFIQSIFRSSYIYICFLSIG